MGLLLAGCAGGTVTTEPPQTTAPPADTSVVPDKIIAQTFDDGPNTDTMVEMIDLLEEYGVKAISQAHDGAIILMHCYSKCTETLEAMRTIIPELRSQGYEFVTVSELFERKGITPETGILYKTTDTVK